MLSILTKLESIEKQLSSPKYRSTAPAASEDIDRKQQQVFYDAVEHHQPQPIRDEVCTIKVQAGHNGNMSIFNFIDGDPEVIKSLKSFIIEKGDAYTNADWTFDYDDMNERNGHGENTGFGRMICKQGKDVVNNNPQYPGLVKEFFVEMLNHLLLTKFGYHKMHVYLKEEKQAEEDKKYKVYKQEFVYGIARNKKSLPMVLCTVKLFAGQSGPQSPFSFKEGSDPKLVESLKSTITRMKDCGHCEALYEGKIGIIHVDNYIPKRTDADKQATKDNEQYPFQVKDDFAKIFQAILRMTGITELNLVESRIPPHRQLNTKYGCYQAEFEFQITGPPM